MYTFIYKVEMTRILINITWTKQNQLLPCLISTG